MKLSQLVDDTRFFLSSKKRVFEGSSHELVTSPYHLEAMAGVLAGKVPLIIAADRFSDIKALIRFSREAKSKGNPINLMVRGGAESWLLAQELAANKIPVMITPSLLFPQDFDSLKSRDDTAKILAQAGVEVIISTQSRSPRRLRQEAAIAITYGLSEAAAMRAITETPARVFGLGEKMGAVAPGQLAQLVLWSGNPFHMDAKVEKMWIRGSQVSLENRQTELARRYLGPARDVGTGVSH